MLEIFPQCRKGILCFSRMRLDVRNVNDRCAMYYSASIYNLPGSDFVYGFAHKKDPEGAKEVTMTWVSYQPKSSPRNVEGATDFQKLNKLIASNGKEALRVMPDLRDRCTVVSAPHIRVVPADESKYFHRSTFLSVPDIRFGVGCKPSTPMKNVVGNKYGVDGERIQREMRKRRSEEKKHQRSLFSQIASRSTIASESHARARDHQSTNENIKEPFKMSKFKNIPSKLDLPPRI